MQSNESIINCILIKAVRAETKCQLPLLHIIPEPVSRISRYQLLIKDAAKEFAKAGDQENAELMEKARLLAADICMYCNNMADAGYITNFDVSILKKPRNFLQSCQFLSALVSSCQLLSALVSSCQLLSALVCSCLFWFVLVSSCQLLSAFVSSCQLL